MLASTSVSLYFFVIFKHFSLIKYEYALIHIPYFLISYIVLSLLLEPHIIQEYQRAIKNLNYLSNSAVLARLKLVKSLAFAYCNF